jgi:hypothetical protein
MKGLVVVFGEGKIVAPIFSTPKQSPRPPTNVNATIGLPEFTTGKRQRYLFGVFCNFEGLADRLTSFNTETDNDSEFAWYYFDILGDSLPFWHVKKGTEVGFRSPNRNNCHAFGSIGHRQLHLNATGRFKQQLVDAPCIRRRICRGKSC